MAITITNLRKLSTNATAVLDNKPKASYMYMFRYEVAGGATSATLNTVHYMSRGTTYDIFTGSSPTPGVLTVRHSIGGAAASVNRIRDFNIGTTYHIAVTYDQGHQILYVNGVPDEFGALTGNTKTDGNAIVFGPLAVTGVGNFIITLQDFNYWAGYALTPAEVAGLRDGSLLPPAVGASADWRGRWTFQGTDGATVALGQPGIANAYGDTAYDVKTITGGGTAVYSPDLIFEAAARAVPKVMSSGGTISIGFTTIGAGSMTKPVAALTAPTIKVNGGSPVTLPGIAIGSPWLTGSHPLLAWQLPGGLRVTPTDTVTISAPAAWCNTQAGITEAMADQPVENCTGKSAFGGDDIAHTFKPGMNGAHLGSQNAGVYTFPKNWRYRCDIFTGGTIYDANGRPTSNPTWPDINSTFYNLGPQNGFDGTMSFPNGWWCVCWDDLNPSDPTTLSLRTDATLLLSIVEHPEYNNPGVGGIGKTRVYWIEQIKTVAQDAGSNKLTSLQLRVSNANKTFNYANDFILCPGDFEPGTPTVVDRSDPYAPSKWLRDRLANGVGSLRYIDVFWGYGGQGSESEPEHSYRLTDYTWGLWGGKINQDAFFTSARPWNPAVTPYIYTTLFGSPYNCTLTNPIDATQTVLTISDAATAPVIQNLRLKAGTELMRVLSVSGTSVTVERGSCNTTPAAHAAGTIQVQNRWAVGTGGVNIPYGQIVELVGTVPHQLNSGTTCGTFGTWPPMTFTDGSHPPAANWKIGGYTNPTFVTGANTVILVLPGTQSPWVTLDGVYALPSDVKLAGKWPSGPAIPIEYGAKLANYFPGCALHLSLGHAATDSLAWAAWKWVRDNLDADRPVTFEYSNEPWNYIFREYEMLKKVSIWLYPATRYGFEWYTQRLWEILQIGKQVWTAAGRDPNLITGVVNSQKGDTSGVSQMLEFAYTTQNMPIDLASIATYFQLDPSAHTHAAIWLWDDDQAVDLCCADYRTNPGSYPALCANMNATINAHNAAHGTSVRLYGYEGGISLICPILSTTLPSAIDAATPTVVVTNAVNMRPGMPLVCGSEYMTIVSIAGNTLTVTRGAYGSVATTHAALAAIRACYIERSHDLLYNPNVYYLEREHYGILQDAGFLRHHTYALSMGSAETGTYYGMYHIQTQVAGRGDGLDGKFDNRLCLATPGKTYTKGPEVDQDANAVSVRGKAFLDWMEEVSGVDEIPAVQNVRLPFGKYRRRV